MKSEQALALVEKALASLKEAIAHGDSGSVPFDRALSTFCAGQAHAVTQTLAIFSRKSAFEFD
jgi:hypothetical protein